MAIHELFAYLHVKNAAAAIDFYTKAFGAKETLRLADASGRIGHAQLDFGGTTLMLSEEFPERGIAGPKPGAPASVTIHLHVDNADQTIDRALAAGATLETPPRDQFYGERSGCIRDPFGHRWNIGHHLQPVTPAEMQRRYLELTGAK